MARSWSRSFRHLDYFFTVTILNSSICKGRMWWLKIHCPWIYRKSWQLWSCKHSSNLWWPPSGEKCRAGATIWISHYSPFSFRLTCMFCKLSPNILLFNICSILHSCYESFVCALLIASENSQGVPGPPAYSLRLPEAETGVESARYVSPCRRQASIHLFPNIVCVFCWVSLFWVGLRSILSYPIWDVPSHDSLIPPSLP